jgi:hypothetical protein
VTDIQNPTKLSDYDFLEFECFVSKVDSEGFTYAYENYSPDFESPEMQALADDMGALRAFYREHAGLIEEWWNTVGGERACDLHNAHIDEARKREDDACLWGVRCTDGHVVHCGTKAYQDQFVMTALENPRYRQPAVLLHRTLPGGEWTETPIAAPAST